MSLNAQFSITFFKIFPGIMPATCSEHTKKSTKKSTFPQKKKVRLISKSMYKKSTFSQKSRDKVHFRQKSTPPPSNPACVLHHDSIVQTRICIASKPNDYS